MVSYETLKEMAMSLPEVTQEPRFDETSFRVRNKIFVTYNLGNNQAVLKFSEVEQDVFIIAGKGNIYAVKNKWGKKGWTVLELNGLEEEMVFDALKSSYRMVAPKTLTSMLKEDH